jgi:recombinational DNA repair ATPase RecF
VLRVESVAIEEFRGIRKLTLNPAGKNFAVCGPNGTGKSGVVDALEFALTGDVSRLGGEGQGEVSLSEHGPHVIVSGHPEKAKVTVRLTIPSLGKSVTLERGVKFPKKPKITPNDADVVRVLKEVESHPEIVLSRRQIIKFVLASPGARSLQVQALLRFEPLDKTRKGLVRIANAAKNEIDPLTANLTEARVNLLRALGIAELTSEQLLVVVNKQREILSLPPLTELRDATVLTDGLEAQSPDVKQRIAKVQALIDLRATRSTIDALATDDVKAKVAEAVAKIDALLSDPAASNAAARESFYSAGVGLILDENCPFCDLQWDIAALRAHLQQKLGKLREITEKRAGITAAIAPILEKLRAVQGVIRLAVQHAKLADPPFDFSALHAHGDTCSSKIQALGALHRLVEAKAALGNLATPKAAIEAVSNLERIVKALPEPSKQDAAKVWLTIAQERLAVYREQRRKHVAGRSRAEKTRKISEAYTRSMDKVLKDVYTSVQEDFVSFYKFINRSDENEFKAKLVPSEGTLDFDVSFYEFGFFPPGAYHSEGHQDGMGLCLYLALMRRLQGGAFTFAVLDDVLMSVDVGHRREVCELIKKEFPDTQLVMTTHDQIWLRHMRTVGLISPKAQANFRGWDVHQGPTSWDDHDVWKEIDAHLARKDVRSAASLLRNFLEYTTAELCHRLRAQVQFREDAQYQLGELLQPAVEQMKKLFIKAKRAANSYGLKDLVDQIAARETMFAAAARATNDEYWYVNPAIHFNSWENLAPNEFEPVARAFRALIEQYVCQKCSEPIRVSPEREPMQMVQCGCGSANLKLVEKPKS